MPKYLIFIAILFGFSTSAFSQERFTYEQMQAAFSSMYVQDVSAEFKSFDNLQQMQDVYGYFLPEKQRAEFFKNWKQMPKVQTHGKIITVQLNKSAPLKIEVVNILTHEFKINGRPYFHDLNGDMVVQLERMRALFKPKKTASLSISPFDLFVPQANAQGWEEIAGAALLAACADGGCEVALTIAEREAVTLLSKEALVRGISFSVSKVAGKEAAVALEGAAEATEKYIIRLGSDLPKIAKDVASDVKASHLVRAGKWIMHALGNGAWPITMSIGIFGGPLVGTAYGQANTNKIPLLTGLRCALAGYVVDSSCPYASARVEVARTHDASSQANAIQVNWCPTLSVNETSVTIPQADGTKTVLVKRNATTGEDKGSTISFMRYEVNANNQVPSESVRNYDLKDNRVVKITRPDISSPLIDASLLLTNKSQSIADSKTLDQDMQHQIDRRAKNFADLEDHKPDIVVAQQDDLKKALADPIAAKTMKLGTDVDWAQKLESSIKPIDDLCNSHATDAAELKDKVSAPEKGAPASK